MLITVVLILGVLAAMALMLSTSTSLDNALVAKHAEGATLDYLTESGMQHTEWQLAQNGSCSGYTDLPSTVFGNHSYSATVTPTSGSPVSVTATGLLADGTARNLTRDNVRVYNSATAMTLILVPGPEGKDSFIEGENGHTTHNKGADNALSTSSESAKEDRTLLQFDLSSLPLTATVQAATLELNATAISSSDVVEAHRLLRDWTEMGVTWETYDGTNSWTTAGGDFDANVAGSFLADSVGPKVMDITDLAKAWSTGALPNFGVVLLSIPASGGKPNSYDSSDKFGGTHPKLTITYLCECGTVCTGIPAGTTIVLSTDNAAVLGGLSFDKFDLAEYDPVTDTATLFLDGGPTTLDKGIDAIHVLANGHILLSTKDDATLGGLSFKDGDLVDYDPVTDTAVLYLEEDLHFAGSNEDITSVYVLSNGNLVLSTDSDAILGGVSFSNRDLVEYNPTTSTASIYFDGDATTLLQNISAVHVLENDHIVMAAAGDTTLGSLSFTPADLIEYDITADSATWFFPGASAFDDSNEKITSVHVGPGSGIIDIPTGVSGTYVDEFNGIAYNGNDGDLDWSNDWQELGESNGPSSSRVSVVSSASQCAGSGCLRIGGDEVSLTGRGVSRQADLDGANTAELSFTIADSGSGASVKLEISDDGGASWTTLQTFTMGSGIPSTPTLQSFDIVAYASSETQIRFIGSGTPDDAAYFYVDDVRIDVDSGGGSGGGSATLPIAHWKLDETSGPTAVDSVGGHDGTWVNGPGAATGKIDGALDFDGADDYVRVPHDATLSLGSAFTISAWVRNDSPSISGSYRILSKESSGSNDNYWLAMQNKTLWVGIDGNFFSAPTTFQPDLWYHVTAGFDDAADLLVIYVNGVEVHNVTTMASLTPNTDPLYIGRNWQGTNFWDGLLDDVRIYDTLLDASEIADLAGGGGGGGGGGGSCDGTFRDEFNARSFSGTDGTLSWATDWIEVGESDGATSGDTQVTNDQSNYQLRTRDNDNGGEGVEREADLSGAASATLSYDYRRSGLDSSSDYTIVEVSANGATGPWTELTRHQGSGNDSSYQPASHNISGFLSTNTRIRFKTSSNMGGSDIVWFDNVEIACTP